VTGNFLLDWAALAVSLFNTILTLWLGLTILLNAERRTPRQGQGRRWGIWVAGGGLLIAGVFFVSHSAIVGEGLNRFSQSIDIWWHIGWWPAIALPLVWYIVTLWYTGYWDTAHSPLHRRQRGWFVFTTFLAATLVVMLIVANPLPSLAVASRIDLGSTPSIDGIPILIVVYPVYIVCCVALSLDALIRPGPSERMMGDLARRRARPWLIGTAITLLLVSLLVAWVMLWIARNAAADLNFLTLTIESVDLIVASLIALAVLLVGQAVVAYEVFTGKALPRHGLQRHWRNAILLAAGYSAVVSVVIALQVRSIYGLLLATSLMTIFYALFSWRTFAERERYIHQLRPFVASQRLYDHLLTPTAIASAPPETDVATPLQALCRDVLSARSVILAAVGPLAPLVGPPVSHTGEHPSLPPLTEITAQLTSPQTMFLPLDSARFGGAQWAVPLWSERGLIGLLLLGEKNDGGLYTQEEIEIARASGERLIDTRASAEMARRLMALQRQQLAESQIVDRRARRILHDDILPQLHAAMLTLNSTKDSSEAISLLTDAHRQISNLLRDMPAAAPDVTRTGLVGALKHVVERELADSFDAVTWHVDPEAERQSHSLPPLTTEVIFYAAREAIRNAARYGRGDDTKSPLHLSLSVTWEGGLKIAVDDDGVGVAASRRADGGSGQGVALHSTLMAVIGGALSVESITGQRTRVLLTLPAA